VKYIYIALGGALGSLLRYAAAGTTYRFVTGIFPWGTMAVNLSGCFIIGFLWAVTERAVLSPNFKPFVFVGILGGYTTFSTFSLESFHLLRDGEVKLAAANMLISTVGGVMLVIAGFVLAEYLLKRIY